MSYGNLGQQKPGTKVVTREDDNSQPGSRSNQSATNAAKAGAKTATSDTYPIVTRETSKASASRPEPDPLSRVGYKKAQNAAKAGSTRPVGNRINRKRM